MLIVDDNKQNIYMLQVLLEANGFKVQAASNGAEALDLAREQYAYCPDLVDQGTETLSALAASLLKDEWWHFWWD